MNTDFEQSIGFNLRPHDNEIQSHDVQRYAKALERIGVSRHVIESCLTLEPAAYAYDELRRAESNHSRDASVINT